MDDACYRVCTCCMRPMVRLAGIHVCVRCDCPQQAGYTPEATTLDD